MFPAFNLQIYCFSPEQHGNSQIYLLFLTQGHDFVLIIICNFAEKYNLV